MILRKQKNAQVLLGNVTHIDLANKTVRSELLGHTYVTPVRQPDRRGRARASPTSATTISPSGRRA